MSRPADTMVTSPPSSNTSTSVLEKDEEANIDIPPSRLSANNGLTKEASNALQPSNTRTNILAVSGLTEHPELPNTYVVGWESDDDPTRPLNWPGWRRWGTVLMVSCITFITPVSSTMFASGVPLLMSEFGVQDRVLSAFVVSIFVLGFVFGPIIFSPLSELHGRLPVYHASNILFLIFNVACAVAPNFGALMVFRFLAGAAGSAALAIGGGTIADVIPIHHRGKAMVLFSMGPILGPVIGPVAGGYATQALGWRWIFWIISITSGVVATVCLVIMRETFAPKLLKQRTVKLQKQYGHVNFRSLYWSPLTERQFMVRSMTRPLHMLVNPIVLALSFYLAIGYGYLYLFFTTLSKVFQDQYGFSIGSSGLSFLGCGIGSIMGAGVYAIWADQVHGYLSKKHGGGRPEYRLPALIVGALFMPVGLFIYGWTAEKQVHYVVPMIGSGIFGFALVNIFVSPSIDFSK